MMCEIFATSADYLLLERNASDLTKEDEKEIIHCYKQAAPAIQEAVRKLLDVPEKEKSYQI